MAKLPPIKRLVREDFKEVPWIDKLLYPFNLLIQSLAQLFRNGLTISENLAAQLDVILVTTSSTAVAGSTLGGQAFPAHATLVAVVPFSCRLNLKPIGLKIVKVVENAGNPAVLRYATTADWSYKDGIITINHVSGLVPGKSYYLTLETSYG